MRKLKVPIKLFVKVMPVASGGFFCMILLFASCHQQTETSGTVNSFENTLAIHLDAIKNGDLARLEPTVNDSVTMISPRGDRIETKDSFMDFHKNWFQLKNYEWSSTIIKTQSTDSLGYALIQYTFAMKDSTGNVQSQNKNYLLLIFKNSKAGWQLVHDQNTTIQQR